MKRFKYNGLMFIAFVLLLIWALSSLVLLDQVTIETVKVPPETKKIRVLIRTGTESAAMRQISQAFEAETGIQVEYIELGRDVYFTSVGTQLLAGTDSFDIVSVPNTSIAQFASAHAILPLDSFIRNPHLTDLPSFDVDDFLSVYRYQGATYALPTDISTHFLYYRSDLISSVPETWDDLFKEARKYTKSHNPESPTTWGLAMPAVVPEERSKIFASLLWSFGGDILKENDGEVLLDQQESIQAGEYLEQLVKEKLVPQDMLSWDFSRTRDALISGEVAMAAPYWNSAYPMIKQAASPYTDSIQISLIPGTKDQNGNLRRIPFQHGWTLAINASSTNPLDAWKFLEFATGKRGGMIYAQRGGIPARRSILSDPSFKVSRPDFSLILESIDIAKAEPSITYYPAMVDIEDKALAKIVTLYANPRETFMEAAHELRQLSGHIKKNLNRTEGNR
ncbi:sugar ABC transporter substrate-binding protein [Paenibacillus validus]|uniref:ABC transporter substrate-binding protein n=1 Tax=Paenibacillus validus TaxID=44253 RepID=UPI000FD6C8DA|nr:sugar ABC transporter substrate-binding protein [Paenibacillus validus]MED4599108.1 sugar ABC transporter substrate-binding protein [Paenibacillus validus]MED4605391.1 sugar ABC transporter substrate-binding protein [Paenibacillus validus]